MKLYHMVKKVYRPKKEVVQEVEKRLACFIVEPGCEADCKCQRCFNEALERLVQKSEEATNVCRANFSFDYELPSDGV